MARLSKWLNTFGILIKDHRFHKEPFTEGKQERAFNQIKGSMPQNYPLYPRRVLLVLALDNPLAMPATGGTLLNLGLLTEYRDDMALLRKSSSLF